MQANAPNRFPSATTADDECPGVTTTRPVLVAFAGWKVEPAWAHTWADQVRRAAVPAATSGLCSIRGPAEASYRSRELDTAGLAHRLLALGPPPTGTILVLAHSSGSFVAHRFFHQLRALEGGRELLAHLRYFNLDGAIGTGDLELDADLVGALGEVHAVYAVDPRTGSESANADDMRALHARAPAKIRLHALDAADSGCAPGAKWCLHDVLITRRPHDPTRFDLARDYGNLDAEHPVQDGYLH